MVLGCQRNDRFQEGKASGGLKSEAKPINYATSSIQLWKRKIVEDSRKLYVQLCNEKNRRFCGYCS